MIPIIIPAYKAIKKLDKCVKHLKAQGVPGEIFIRDNSNDNIYFTAAVNEGIKNFLSKPNWKYIIIINQDMYLKPNALDEMIRFMEEHPKCGIGMPIQLGDDNYASFAGGLQAFPIGVCCHGRVELYWANAELAWASGGCLILRREMINEIGLLDENFRFIGSDSDYCWQARSRGWQVWRIAKAKGIHDHGQALARDCGYELNLIKLNDMLFFAKKWITGGLYRELADKSEDTTAERIDKEIANLVDIKDRLIRRTL